MRENTGGFINFVETLSQILAMNETINTYMEKLDENYTCSFVHLEEDKKIYLGDKNARTCRFCKKSEPEVHFKQDTHALPEFTGNKYLFSYYECDECNQKFSVIESNMAEYMKLYHTMSQVKGKKGVPSFKPNMQQNSRIDVGEDNVKIQSYEGDDFSVDINETDKVITINGARTYVPSLVFKCLTKIALTIMPEEELVNFVEIMEWVCDDKKILKKLPPVFFHMYAGIKPFDFITYALFKRKATHKEPVPYMMFILTYSNFVFQLPIVSKKMDIGLGDMKFYCCPTPIDIDQGKVIRETLDLSSDERKIRESCSINMGYEWLEE